MEKYLISLTIRERVEPADVTSAVIHAAEEKCVLLVLGTKGGLHSFFGAAQVNKHTAADYAKAAAAGLLYTQRLEGNDYMAFASQLDPTTGMPVLMEEYKHAFAMRSKEGVKPEPKVEQAALELKS